MSDTGNTDLKPGGFEVDLTYAETVELSFEMRGCYVEYLANGRVHLDGRFTLDELRRVIDAMESP